jgi:single-stranded-DNA-specific exonuclease
MRRGADALGDPELWIDHDLPFAQMTTHLMRHIDQLEPFGERNEKPVLLSRDLRLAEPPRTVGADGAHLCVRLRHGAHAMRAMGFRLGARAADLHPGTPLEAVYTPRWNVFRGETSLELVLHDFRPAPG